MSHSTPFRVLLLLTAIATTNFSGFLIFSRAQEASLNCRAEVTCETCAPMEGCQWCGSVMKSDVTGGFEVFSDKPLGFGRCVAAGENCAELKIGELDSLLIFGFTAGPIRAQYRFELEKFEVDEERCNEFPTVTVTAQSEGCESCAKAEQDAVWCPISLRVKHLGVNLHSSYGGLCLPSVPDACDVLNSTVAKPVESLTNNLAAIDISTGIAEEAKCSDAVGVMYRNTSVIVTVVLALLASIRAM